MIDTQLRTPPSAQLLPRRDGAVSGPRTIIACGLEASARRAAKLEAQGAEIWRVRTKRNGRVDLIAVARRLADAGLLAILVEGGGELHASLLRADLADQLVIYLAPKVVGGPAPSWVGGQGISQLADAFQFTFATTRVVGDDIQIIADRRAPDEPRD